MEARFVRESQVTACTFCVWGMGAQRVRGYVPNAPTSHIVPPASRRGSQVTKPRRRHAPDHSQNNNDSNGDANPDADSPPPLTLLFFLQWRGRHLRVFGDGQGRARNGVNVDRND